MGSQLTPNANTNAKPPTTIGSINACFNATRYASSTPGNAAAETTPRSFVAPALITTAELTDGAWMGELLCQRVGEEVLRDGDRYRAAEGIGRISPVRLFTHISRFQNKPREAIGEEVEGAHTPTRHILRIQNHLHRNKRDLHRRSRPRAREDLIPDPVARRAAQLQSNTAAPAPIVNITEPIIRKGTYHPTAVMLPPTTRDARVVGHEVGDRADAGAFGGGAFYGLEVEGEIVDVAITRL